MVVRPPPDSSTAEIKEASEESLRALQSSTISLKQTAAHSRRLIVESRELLARKYCDLGIKNDGHEE